MGELWELCIISARIFLKDFQLYFRQWGKAFKIYVSIRRSKEPKHWS